MRKTFVLGKTFVFATIAALGLSASAMASNQWDPDSDKEISLGTFTLFNSGAGGPTNDFVFTYVAQGNEVGFTFYGTYSEVVALSWASDTKLVVSVNNNPIYSLGGISTTVLNNWDFQGSQSTLPGAYRHGWLGVGTNADGLPDWGIKGLMNAGDIVTFRFFNDWNSSQNITWTDANLIIHKLPAPGALALLGLAGVIGGSRRRRA